MNNWDLRSLALRPRLPEILSSTKESPRDRARLLVEFAPGERHEVTATSDARLLLLLTPWPGSGHPGGMTIRQKLYARRHAAKQTTRLLLHNPDQSGGEIRQFRSALGHST